MLPPYKQICNPQCLAVDVTLAAAAEVVTLFYLQVDKQQSLHLI